MNRIIIILTALSAMCNLAYAETNGISDTEDYSISLIDSICFYYNAGNLDTAIEFDKKLQQHAGRTYLATYLNAMAFMEERKYNLANAIKFGKEAIYVQEQTGNDDNIDYIASMMLLARYTSHSGDYKESLNILRDAVGKLRHVPENKEFTISLLSELASCHNNLLEYNEALRICDNITAIIDGNQMEESIALANTIVKLSVIYSDANNNKKAISLAKKAIAIYERLEGEEYDVNEHKAIALNNLGNFYYLAGMYSDARKLYAKSMLIRQNYNGKNHPQYAASLSSLALINSQIGDYEEAIRLSSNALRIYEAAYGQEHHTCLNELCNLASYNLSAGNLLQATILSTQALTISKKTGDKRNINYINALEILASCQSEYHKYDEAIKLCNEAARISKELYGEQSANYGDALNNLAVYNYYTGNDSVAAQLALQSLEITIKASGKNHPDKLPAMQNLIAFFFDYDTKKAEKAAIDALDATSEFVISSFRDLTSSERQNFWYKNKRLYEYWLPKTADKIRSSSLIMAAYDGALLSKGILLNSDIEMSRLLLESGDTAIVALYDGMLANRAFAGKQRENLAMRTDMDDSLRMSARRLTDSLERAANRQERELVERSKAFGDYTKNLAVGWRDVQSRLSDDDIAIEFLEIPLSGDSAIYAAMTLRRGYDCPRFTRLFEKHQLTGLDRSLLFSSPALYDLVWKPLEEELSGMKNVYFSPAGELHRTAIEYAPVSEDTIFSDRYNAFRLSSTRQLAVTGDNGNDVDGEGAVLYGGLRYNARPSVIAADSRKYAASDDGTRSAPVMPELAADSLIARGTRIAELPATKVEVDSIGTMMRGRSVDVSLFTDTTGTEASFKALSGQRRGIIHIATHGFFGKNDPADNALATPDAGRTTRHTEDKAMTRSGLLFAGAANAWQMPDTVDNGILTAQEVSALDLRGLDLCVLSACETGLGEITGEGVFGLQRGFKKAGAGTLMVSLRPVYDKATGLLMTEFYRNLLAGKSKTASLKAAQQYLRNYEEPATEDAAQAQGGAGRAGKFAKARQHSAAATNAPTATVKPYADPVYWAYFILVDAL